MRHRSPKRAAQERQYRKMRDEFMADHPNCERCWQRATELHHMRGRVGADLLRREFWQALCSSCHRWVTEHPRAAVEQGYSLPRIGRAS